MVKRYIARKLVKKRKLSFKERQRREREQLERAYQRDRRELARPRSGRRGDPVAAGAAAGLGLGSVGVVGHQAYKDLKNKPKDMRKMNFRQKMRVLKKTGRWKSKTKRRK